MAHQTIETVIVGGGQAGLSISHYLKQRGIDHLVLEKRSPVHAWRTQRKANDWVGFARNLSEVVKLARQEAHMLADATAVIGTIDLVLGDVDR